MTPPRRYTTPAIWLHWLVAAAITAGLVLVWIVDSLPDAWSRPTVDLHKSLGLTVLGLAILRVTWRYAHPPPPLPAGYSRWEHRLSHAAHMGLYALIFLLPISGWMHDSAWKDAAAHPLRLFYVIPWFRLPGITTLDPATKEAFHSVMFQIHGALAYGLYALVALHIAGALKHQFRDREAELQRMWPGPQ